MRASVGHATPGPFLRDELCEQAWRALRNNFVHTGRGPKGLIKAIQTDNVENTKNNSETTTSEMLSITGRA